MQLGQYHQYSAITYLLSNYHLSFMGVARKKASRGAEAKTVLSSYISCPTLNTDMGMILMDIIRFTIQDTVRETIIKACHFPLCATAALSSSGTIYHPSAFVA